MCGAWCLQMCFFMSFSLPLIISVQYHTHVSILDGVEVDMVSYHHDHIVSYRMHPLRRRHPDPSHESNRHKRHLHYHEGKRLLRIERERKKGTGGEGDEGRRSASDSHANVATCVRACVSVCVCCCCWSLVACCNVCVCVLTFRGG